MNNVQGSLSVMKSFYFMDKSLSLELKYLYFMGKGNNLKKGASVCPLPSFGLNFWNFGGIFFAHVFFLMDGNSFESSISKFNLYCCSSCIDNGKKYHNWSTGMKFV